MKLFKNKPGLCVICAIALSLAGCGQTTGDETAPDRTRSSSGTIEIETADKDYGFSFADETTTEEAEELTEAETVTEAETELTAETTAAVFDSGDGSYVEYHFRTDKQLQQHFEKHGSEFDGDFSYSTAQEYEKGASDVINDPDALYKTEAEDGDGVYYIEESNEFVILSTDGYIRTYFRPSSGKKYFDRQ